MSKYFCGKCNKKHAAGYKKHWKYRVEKPEAPKSLTDCSKQDLLKRIEEVMTRAMGNIPNSVISENWDWDKFKLWLTEPFWALNYEEYDDSREI